MSDYPKDEKTPFIEITSVPTDDVVRPPKQALKQRGLRAGEKRGQNYCRLGGIMMLLSYATLFWEEPGSALLFYAIGMCSAFVVSMFGLYLTVKAQRKMKCQGCWKTAVRTPHCPWCGTKDPIGDYEEWVEEEKVKAAAKAAKGGRCAFWHKK